MQHFDGVHVLGLLVHLTQVQDVGVDGLPGDTRQTGLEEAAATLGCPSPHHRSHQSTY